MLGASGGRIRNFRKCLYDILDSAGNGVLKRDTAVRVRVSRERREQLLGEFATSGISARRFVQLPGAKPVTFYSWLQKQRPLGSETPVRSAGSPVSFMEAVLGVHPAVQSCSDAPHVVHLREDPAESVLLFRAIAMTPFSRATSVLALNRESRPPRHEEGS
jgi:hypothetical protein